MHGTNRIDMTEGSILGKLLQFSIPLIFSSVLQLFFNVADVAVVGRFAGDESLAAVGSTGSLINLLVNLFMGLSVGTNVVAAHYFGARKQTHVQDTVHTAIVVSFLSGIVLTVIGVLGAKSILTFMRAPENVLNLAALYLKIYFGGITATMIYNFGSALLRAKGDTFRPLFILILAGCVNFVLNLVFVICFKLGVAGVAFATVISQCISAALVLTILFTEKDDFQLKLKRLKINPHIFVKILKIGLPAGFQGIMFSFSNVIIQSSVNSFGAIIIAGNSAAINLESIVYTAMNGFSQGALTFCSQNFGAKKIDRIKKVVFVAQGAIIVIGSLLGWGFLIFGRQLLGIFSKNPVVIDAGMLRMRVILSTYCLCGMMDCMANSIRGTGHSLMPVISSLLGACIFRIIWLFTVFLIPRFHTPTVIFLSYPISWVLTYIINIICYKIFISKLQGDLQ